MAAKKCKVQNKVGRPKGSVTKKSSIYKPTKAMNKKIKNCLV
jgi:hypothetical protein